MTDFRLTALAVSTPKAVWLSLAKIANVERVDEVVRYINEVYRLAPLVGLSPDWIVAQASHETDYFRSPIWKARLNPVGIGVTDGPDHGYGYRTGTTAAQGQIVHMWGYVKGTTLTSELLPYLRLDPRWDALMQSDMAGVVKTIDDLGNGRWASDPHYAAGLRRHFAALIAPVKTETPTMGFDIGNRPVQIAIGTGHANASGGNAFELGINRLTVNDFLKLARRSDGFDVRCYTPNDGLGYFNGPLDAAAALVRTWIAQGWKPDICIEVHQEGLGQSSVRGGHVIYPDSAGLNGRKATGSDTIDKDVKAAAGEMSRLMTAEYGGVTRYKPPRGMSEKETGVAEPPGRRRLGLFGAWSDEWFVNNACCLITEGATYTNPTDLALMKRKDYPQNLAMGILKALIHLAESRGNWTFAYKIGGVIVPTDPKPVGAQPIPIAELKPYVQAGQIIKAPPIDGITAANGDVFEYLGYQVRTLRSINRRQSAAANAPVIGETPIASNTVLDPGFLVHLKAGGTQLITPWWSWIDPADVEIVIESIAA